MHQQPEFADLVHMLAVDFDTVDGNIGVDDSNRYNGCDSVGCFNGICVPGTCRRVVSPSLLHCLKLGSMIVLIHLRRE